jgi:hypothetical protein
MAKREKEKASPAGTDRGGLATRAGISGTVGIASRQTIRVSARDVDATSAAGKNIPQPPSADP